MKKENNKKEDKWNKKNYIDMESYNRAMETFRKFMKK